MDEEGEGMFGFFTSPGSSSSSSFTDVLVAETLRKAHRLDSNLEENVFVGILRDSNLRQLHLACELKNECGVFECQLVDATRWMPPPKCTKVQFSSKKTISFHESLHAITVNDCSVAKANNGWELMDIFLQCEIFQGLEEAAGQREVTQAPLGAGTGAQRAFAPQ